MLALNGFEYGIDPVVGTEQNLQNYIISNLLQVDAPLLQAGPPRLFMMGYCYLQADLVATDQLMTSLNIPHVYIPGWLDPHYWDADWVSKGVSELLSLNLPDPPVGVPEIAVSGNNQDIVDGASDSTAANGTNFGTASIGSTGPASTFTVSNDGSAALTLGDVTVPAGFELVGALPASLPPGASATFSIQLVATAVGSYSGDVSFTNNDEDGGAGAQNPFEFLVTGTVANPPTVATPAAVTLNPVTGITAALGVLGADDAGESNLTYTWSTTSLPSGAGIPTFSDNGTNTAKNTTVTFFQAGSYTFQVTITDTNGLTVTSTASIDVSQVFASIVVEPLSSDPGADGAQQFAATAVDQFGDALATQPAFVWSAPDGETIDENGNYAPPYATGPAAVVASSGLVVGTLRPDTPRACPVDRRFERILELQQRLDERGFRRHRGRFPGCGTSWAIWLSSILSSPETVMLDGESEPCGNRVQTVSADDSIEGTGGTLQFNAGPNSATITTAAGSQTINAPVQLASDLIVSPAAGSQLTISSGLSGESQTLTVNNQGTVVSWRQHLYGRHDRLRRNAHPGQLVRDCRRH